MCQSSVIYSIWQCIWCIFAILIRTLTVCSIRLFNGLRVGVIVTNADRFDSLAEPISRNSSAMGLHANQVLIRLFEVFPTPPLLCAINFDETLMKRPSAQSHWIAKTLLRMICSGLASLTAGLKASTYSRWHQLLRTCNASGGCYFRENSQYTGIETIRKGYWYKMG